MVQNLALDLDVDEEGNAVAVSSTGNTTLLDETNTDISGVWKGVEKTENKIPTAEGTDNTNARSWNLGEIILTNPTTSKRCDNILAGEDITNCEWYKNVQNLTAGYIATATNSISPDGQTYDAHYLIGNYYQWRTAVANTFTSDVVGTYATGANGEGLTNVLNSICPKNWQLPKAGRNESSSTNFGVGAGQSYDIDKSFYGLMKSYGYINSWSTDSNNASMPITAGDKRLDVEPMYFVRSGSLSFSKGLVNYPGSDAYLVSSTLTPLKPSTLYYFYANHGLALPSNSYGSSDAMSVRCVAR